MRKLLSVGCLILFNAATLSWGLAQPVIDLKQPAAQRPYVNGQFAFNVYSSLALEKGNIFFSPYSLTSALEMTYEGASGTTAQEMRAVLHLDANDRDRRSYDSAYIKQLGTPDKFYELSVANALWVQQGYPFKPDFLNLTQSTYFAQAQNLDFESDPEAARVTINQWVLDKTKKRINDLLPPGSINSSTPLVLTDAVYFKGKWVTPFDKGFTQSEDFWITPDRTVKTDMMRVSQDFDYFENDLVQVLQIPYQGDRLSMLVILPRSKDIHGLEKIFTQDAFLKWENGLCPQQVNLTLPKFKFDSGYEMSRVLGELGMGQAFDVNKADFSGMAQKILGKNLYIGAVFHKAWINTDEEGTEAAAATAVNMMEAATANPGPDVSKDFIADHPFIFVIEDTVTGHFLFMGRVSDPREK